jgi:hypothetical protein
MTDSPSLVLQISPQGIGNTNSLSSTKDSSNTVLMEEVGSSRDETREENELEAHYARQSWPLRNITVPHNNDVLFGRGGGTNSHPGNKRYRQLVEESKSRYLAASRNEKPLIAFEIVRFLREQQTPPGRFLQMNEMTKKWDDVGYKRAREKTSQALREKLNYAPNTASKVDEKGGTKQRQPPLNGTTTVLSSRDIPIIGVIKESSTPSPDEAPPKTLEYWPTLQPSNSDAVIGISTANSVDKASPTEQSVLQQLKPDLPPILPSQEQERWIEDSNALDDSVVVPHLSPPKKQHLHREHSLTGYPLNDDDDDDDILLPGNVLVLAFEPERMMKRATSHNVEKDKNLKMPRRTSKPIERQHSLAGVYLPGARIDIPAEMFSSNEFNDDDLPPTDLITTNNASAPLISMDVTSLLPNCSNRKQLLELMKMPRSNDLGRHSEQLLLPPNDNINNNDHSSSVFRDTSSGMAPCDDSSNYDEYAAL